ncbi:MAG TPA: hypothetical protein VJL29_12725 [Thermoguttaceae bacterium]|nr:hypothetical protein [Thermoguttaceae bacterium]
MNRARGTWLVAFVVFGIAVAVSVVSPFASGGVAANANAGWSAGYRDARHDARAIADETYASFPAPVPDEEEDAPAHEAKGRDDGYPEKPSAWEPADAPLTSKPNDARRLVPAPRHILDYYDHPISGTVGPDAAGGEAWVDEPASVWEDDPAGVEASYDDSAYGDAYEADGWDEDARDDHYVEAAYVGERLAGPGFVVDVLDEDLPRSIADGLRASDPVELQTDWGFTRRDGLEERLAWLLLDLVEDLPTVTIFVALRHVAEQVGKTIDEPQSTNVGDISFVAEPMVDDLAARATQSFCHLAPPGPSMIWRVERLFESGLEPSK